MKTKPIIKLYTYQNGFTQIAQIDDYESCSFEHNLYQAGQFIITINYNIPNAQLFQRGMFIQLGNDSYMFGEILSVTDEIGQDGKGSQVRTITGYDARYLFKRRVIKNMNNNGTWAMTARGEACLRNLVLDQCGSNAETKRQLPIINTIPETPIGKNYSVSESFSNLYETLVTIATQSEIGWRVKFDENLTLECYQGTDRQYTVRFDTDYESLASGNFVDSSESYANTIYIGGKGQGAERDLYEGEAYLNECLLALYPEQTDLLLIDNVGSNLRICGNSPEGLDRYEAYDNQSSMTIQAEYEAEALSMLTQYGQTVEVQGQGLVKCPYVFKEQYFVGDSVTIAFSGKSAVVQILSVIEHWVGGTYELQFSFGKPINDLTDQLQLMLRKIQEASNKTNSTDSVRYYTLPTDTQMPSSDVTYGTIGFTGDVGTGATFTLYLDNQATGSKTYHVYMKQVTGSGQLTLTTGQGADLLLDSGTYVTIIYVDDEGNIYKSV